MSTFTPCDNLLSLRKEIDSLDQRLAAILCERLQLIHRAAPFKPTRDDVRLEDRIEEIIDKVLPVADRYTITHAYLENVFRFIIERSIESEERQWERLHCNASD